MAEIGTFAAALQLAELAIKLKKLYNDIQDGPKDLIEYLEEVAVLAELAESLGGLRRQPSIATSGADDGNWRKCYRLFQMSVESAQKTVEELSVVLRRHKTTGPLRLYLRRSQLKKCMSRLERRRKIMSDAQQAYAHAISVHQSVVLDEIRSHLLQRPTITSSADGQLTGHSFRNRPYQSRRNTQRPKQSNRASATNIAPRTNPRKYDTATLFSVQLPLWTIWKCFDILVARGNRSYSLNLRIYNLRPNDSELFQAAREGSRQGWKRVRRMLANNTASPFDVDESGTTLLHIAASQVNPKICRFLLQECGLDVSIETWYDHKAPFEAFALAFRPPYTEDPGQNTWLDTWRLLTTAGCGDTFDDDNGLKHWSHRCSLPSNVLSELTADVRPSYESINPTLRAKFAMSSISLDPKSITVLLGQDLSLEQAFKLRSKNFDSGYGHYSLLTHITRCISRPDLSEDYRLGWLNLIKSIISFESNNTSTVLFRSIYTHYIVFYLSSRKLNPSLSGNQSLNQKFTAIGKEWLRVLVDCGASLDRYSKAERATLRNPETFVWLDRRGVFHSYQLKFLLSGPDIDDWKFFVVPHMHEYKQTVRPGSRVTLSKGHDEYEMAGEFWYVVEENPMPDTSNLPGGFPVEECSKIKSRLTVGKPVKVKGPIF